MTLVALAALVAPAWADRPDTDGEAWSFAVDDEVVTLDGPTGQVRVHYAASGPSVSDLTDDDGDGLPDLPQAVAEAAEAALEVFADLGFRPLVAEADLGLDALGGNGAIDIYMVDFAGTGDGRFELDGCEGGVCVGHLLTDNDFAESYYSDAAEAAAVLTSHELFHGVQAAYRGSLPPWMSEGTATWGEHLYDADLDDYYGFCSAYLAEPTRAIDSPPAGVATAWSYGTALFFGFLGERHGPQVGPALLEAMESTDEDDAVLAIADVLEAEGDSLAEAWPVFAEWNLATGRQSGGTAAAWPEAGRLRAPPFEVEADDGLLDDDNRFYPLAATYFTLEHAGGPLSFAFADDPTGLVFGLHPFAGGASQGAVDAAVAQVQPDAAGRLDLGELPAGGYALVGSYPQPADESTKVRFCLGAPDAVEGCLEVEEAPAGDSGQPDDDTGPGPSKDGPPPEEAGCGCATGGAPFGAGLWALLAVVGLSRRRAPEA